MDLNYLLFHHQLSLIGSVSPDAMLKANACRLASHYQRRIDRLREQMGVTSYPHWLRQRPQPGLIA